jgi:hypothetical protein
MTAASRRIREHKHEKMKLHLEITKETGKESHILSLCDHLDRKVLHYFF